MRRILPILAFLALPLAARADGYASAQAVVGSPQAAVVDSGCAASLNIGCAYNAAVVAPVVQQYQVVQRVVAQPVIVQRQVAVQSYVSPVVVQQQVAQPVYAVQAQAVSNVGYSQALSAPLLRQRALAVGGGPRKQIAKSRSVVKNRGGLFGFR